MNNIILLLILTVSLAFIIFLFSDIWYMWRSNTHDHPNKVKGTFVCQPVPKHPDEMGELHVQLGYQSHDSSGFVMCGISAWSQ
jgi:hypothetical protein